MYITFNATQKVEIAVPDAALSIENYLRQPRRLIKVLVDPTRLEELNAESFRLKMRELKFLTVSLKPTVDLKVWAKPNGTLYLQSIGCEISGIEYLKQHFQFNLVGGLYAKQIDGITYLKGEAELTVGVDLPPALQLTPKPILEATGNSLLNTVLLTIKQRISDNLVKNIMESSETN